MLHEVFEAMEMDVEGNNDGQINVGANEGVGADEVPHEVMIEADGGVGAKVVYCDVMTTSRRHNTTGPDGPLCHDTIGSA